ncbi:MAG TPA: hypothetical protein H9964_06725, partial [Candidatus Gallimonas intestinavium]|nr:hypothetical protein [Candidatus Gallimonas intestinavium]
YVANVSRYQLCYIPEVVKDGFCAAPSLCQMRHAPENILMIPHSPQKSKRFAERRKKNPLLRLGHFHLC